MKLLSAALLSAAIGHGADPGGSLAPARALLDVEIAVPQLSIELPGANYRCFRMRLSTARGLAARRSLEDLKATLARLKEELKAFDEGHGSADKALSLAQTFEAKAADGVKEGLLVDEPEHDLLGVSVSPRRLRSDLVDGDYQMQRDPTLPNCANSG